MVILDQWQCARSVMGISRLELAVKNVAGPKDRRRPVRQSADTVPTAEKQEKLLKKSVPSVEKTLSDFGKATRGEKWGQDETLIAAALAVATKLTQITV